MTRFNSFWLFYSHNDITSADPCRTIDETLIEVSSMRLAWQTQLKTSFLKVANSDAKSINNKQHTSFPHVWKFLWYRLYQHLKGIWVISDTRQSIGGRVYCFINYQSVLITIPLSHRSLGYQNAPLVTSASSPQNFDHPAGSAVFTLCLKISNFRFQRLVFQIFSFWCIIDVYTCYVVLLACLTLLMT